MRIIDKTARPVTRIFLFEKSYLVKNTAKTRITQMTCLIITMLVVNLASINPLVESTLILLLHANRARKI